MKTFLGLTFGGMLVSSGWRLILLQRQSQPITWDQMWRVIAIGFFLGVGLALGYAFVVWARGFVQRRVLGRGENS